MPLNLTIEYLAHACFAFSNAKGSWTILTDPYSNELGYQEAYPKADYTLVSVQDGAHNNLSMVSGPTQKIAGGSVKSFHQGSIRPHLGPKTESSGYANFFTLEFEEKRLLFIAQAQPTPEQLEQLAKEQWDFLLISVGGKPGLNPKQAISLITKLAPKWSIPMMYKTPFLHQDKFLELLRLDSFLQQNPYPVVRPRDFRLESEKLPTTESPQILILDHKY